jgi:zinc finger protein
MAALPDSENWKEGNEESISEMHGCYCPNCEGGNGKTIMLPTKVPMFREIYIMTLHCPDCNFKNSEVNFGGEIQPKGEKLTLTLTCADDLNRQLIKSDSATILIPSIELEIPALTQRGTISTIEGVLTRAAENLEALQPERLKLGDVDNFHRCRLVIKQLMKMSGNPAPDSDDEEEEGDDDANKNEDQNIDAQESTNKSVTFEPFEIILDDPAGNSFIENPHAPKPDPSLTSVKYTRTARQDMSLGLQPSKEAVEAGTIDDSNPAHKNIVNDTPSSSGKHTVDVSLKNNPRRNIGKEEALKFPTTCASCYRSCETTMCVTDIPHFKEVIIMSLLCESCGYKSNEIKGAGSIPKFGTRVILKATCQDDLGREVLKSDTAGIEIPEVELELDEGGLDGLYTTVEGLLEKLHDRLKGANPFQSGDAAKKQHLSNDGGEFSKPSLSAQRYMEFLDNLKGLKEGRGFPFTLIISDPLSNSFVGPIPSDAIALALQAEKDGNNDCYHQYVDKYMEIEEYERTFDQNEILGLNDIKTENYQIDDQDDGKANNDGEFKEKKYYGTDQPEELPDRLRRPDIRGPDHPHAVAKADVEGDNTVMGPGSANFATPGLMQRGKVAADRNLISDAKQEVTDIAQIIKLFEKKDMEFIMCEEFDGPRPGMVFKLGAQGIGYYTDKELSELLKRTS